MDTENTFKSIVEDKDEIKIDVLLKKTAEHKSTGNRVIISKENITLQNL